MLDLETIGIAVETSSLERGKDMLTSFAKSADSAADSADKLGGKASKAFGDTADEAKRLPNEMQNINNLMSAIEGSAVKLGKQLAGLWVVGKAVDAIKEMTMLNARYEELGIVMGVVGKNAGYTAQQMDFYAKSVQKAGIAMLESRNTVIQLAQANVDLSTASKLARVAQDAAVIGNINSSEALQSMIHGIKTAQTDVLRTIGINVSFEQSYKDLAKTLGVSTSALTENQKMQARQNAVMQEGEKIAGAYEASMGTAGKQIRSMTRYIEDMKVISGSVFNEMLTVGVMALTEGLKDANGEVTALAQNGQLENWGESLTDTVVWIADAVGNFVITLQKAGLTMAAMAATATTFSSAGRDAIQEQYRIDIEALNAGENKFGKALDMRREARAQKAEQERLLTIKQNEEFNRLVDYYQNLRNQGVIKDVQYIAAINQLYKSMYTGGGKEPEKANDTVSKKASEYEKLAKSIRESLEAAQDELSMGDKLSSSDKQRLADIKKVKEAYKDKQISQTQMTKLLADVEIAASARNDAEATKYIANLQKQSAEVGKTASEIRLMVAQKLADANPKYAEAILREARAFEDKTKAAAATALATKEMAKANAELVASGEKMLKSLEDEIDKQRDYNETIGLSKYDVERLKLEKMELSAQNDENAASGVREAAAMAGPMKDALLEYADQLEKAAGRKRELIGLKAIGVEADETYQSYKALWDAVDKTAHDTFINIFEGGQDAFTKLRDTLKSGLLELLYQMTIKKWIIDIQGNVSGGVSGAISSATGGGGGGGSSPLSSLMSAGFSKLTNGITIAGSSIAAIGSSVLTGIQAGWAGTSVAGAASAYSAAGMTGVSTGLTAGSAIGSTAATVSSAITSTLAAIPGWGWALMALATQFDQNKITKTGTGVEANLSGGGASNVQAITTYKQDHHGVFGIGAYTTHNKEREAAGTEVSDALSTAVQAITATNRRYAESLGLSTAALDTYTMALSVNTTGLDQAATSAAIAAELTKFSTGQMAAAFGDAVAQFQKSGESVGDTIQRLIAVTQVSEALNSFGGIFSKIASSGVAATEAMISLSGGLDQLIAKSTDFVKNYYSAEETGGMDAKNILATLSSVGIDAASLTTKEEFRALLEGTSTQTQQGLEQINALLNVQGIFSQLSTTLESQSLNLGDLASLAPTIASLEPLFAATTATGAAAVDVAEQTLEGINATTSAVTDGTTSIVGAITTMGEVIAVAVQEGIAAGNAVSARIESRLNSIDANSRLELAAP